MIERDQKITPLASNSIFGTNSPNVYFRLEKNTSNFIFNFRLPANTSLCLLDSLYFCHVCSVGRPLFLICLASFLPSFSTSFFGNSGRKCKKKTEFMLAAYEVHSISLFGQNWNTKQNSSVHSIFTKDIQKQKLVECNLNLSTIYFKLKILIKKLSFLNIYNTCLLLEKKSTTQKKLDALMAPYSCIPKSKTKKLPD